MAARTNSNLVTVFVIVLALIISGFSYIIYLVYPQQEMPAELSGIIPAVNVGEFILILGVGFSLVLSGFIFVVKTVFLTGGKR